MHKKRTTRSRMDAYRARLRAQKLRPVQLWLPDTRRPGFAAECRRQSLLASKSTQESEALAFIEAAADFDAWN